MSKPRNKNAGGAGVKQRPARSGISLTYARKMLPLVRQIISDVQARWNRLSELEQEQGDLDKRRRGLDWPERARRYQITEEIAAEQRGLQDTVDELEKLELVLVDAIQGEVAFPTAINGRKAYYIWRAGENDVKTWCYAHDPARHPVKA
jgi:hypothetical protein